MWKIYFRSEQETIYFCKVLSGLVPHAKCKWIRHTYWGNELQIDAKISIRHILLSFVKVFMAFRFQTILVNEIEKTYHYSDPTEINRILEWTDWVLHDSTMRLQLFSNKTLDNFLFFHLFKQLKHVQKIHFDSVITFCMKPLQLKLIEAIGYAIDEMKREEEYQHYLHAMREYVKRGLPKCDKLFVLQTSEQVMFNQNGEILSHDSLLQLMRKEPLYLLGLDENERNLAPIISLLPEKLYIYNDCPTDVRALTLMNVFEERAYVQAIAEFPFLVKRK